MQSDPSRKIKKHEKRYSLNQCVLYKIASKARLAAILGAPLRTLESLAEDAGNYKLYERPAEVCPFTGKPTKARAVQEPVEALKAVHARIQSLLIRIKVPDYCHGAMPGRSYRTNAKVHLSSMKVATFDIRKFFPTTSVSRVYDFFRDRLCCSPDVSALLSQLCTYNGALATGSPVSPVLSYLANALMFEELAEVAIAWSLKFTVYVDDLTFSGDVIPTGLRDRVKAIVEKNGHRLHEDKTRVFGAGEVKHITGVVINAGKISVPHVRFLKARGIQDALDRAVDSDEKLTLLRKLAGLLGEAAYLDPAFRIAADRAYRDLADITALMPKKPSKVPVRRSRKRFVLRPVAQV